MNETPDPMLVYALVCLQNRDHLAHAYGEDFALAALRALQWRLHRRRCSVVAIDSWRILVVLPRSKQSAEVDVDALQLSLVAETFTYRSYRAFLIVGVSRVEARGGDFVDSNLLDIGQAEIECMTAPAVPSVLNGRAGALSYAADMGIALLFLQGLVQKRISLALQPIVSAAREREPDVLYSEALLRVSENVDEPDEPDISDISPCELVLALERLGLARLLDYVVLDAVLTQLEGDPCLRLGCNLSSQSLVPCANGWGRVFDRLRNAPEVAKRLTLEITETAPLPDFAQAVRFVKNFQQLGCAIAIDDFGTGHTRLDFVRAVAPQVIKLSGDLVHAAGESRTAATHLQCLVALATSLSPHVVAEAVATPKDRAAVKLAGVHWMQGYLFASASIEPMRLPLTLPAHVSAP